MTLKKKVPQRTCAGCRRTKDKENFIRIVRDKDGKVFPDLTGKQNGRGAYLCRNRDCLNQALKRRGLERTLKVSTISDDVIQTLKQQLGEVYE